MADNPIDIIATQILFDAKSALINLDELNLNITDTAKKTKILKDIIRELANKMGGDIKLATNALNKLTKALGMNPVLIKALGKELELIDKIAGQLGWSVDAVEKHFAGLAIVVSQGTGNIVVFGTTLKSALAQGIPLLTVMQTALMAISTQISIINGQLKSFASGGNRPQLGAGGSGQRGGGGNDFIDAEWRFAEDGANGASKAYDRAGESAKKAGGEAKKAGQAGAKAGKDTESAFSKAVNSVNVMRIALGALISMLLFQGIQAVTSFFKTASDQAKQMEETMYRLKNAEKILSEAGQDITLKGLEDGITRIQKLLPIFAREDIAQLMGAIALGTQQLGYTEEQMIDLGQAVGLLNVQSTKGEDLMTTWSHVLTSLLGKSSTGIAQLGISFNETEKQAAAMELQLLENGRTLQDLTDDELAAVKLRILMKNANVDDAESLAMLNDFLDSNSSKLQQNASAWKDLQTTVGQFINNILPNVVPMLERLQESFEVQGVQGLFKQAGANRFNQEDSRIMGKLAAGIALTREEYEKLKATLSTLSDKDILKIFPDPSAIKDRFTRELIQSLVDIKDTATGLPDPLIPNPVDEEALKTLDELDEKLRDIAMDAQQARDDLAVALSQKQEDLDVKFTQKTQDIDTEYQRKEVDAAVDLQRKISDIERDAERERQRVLDKAREDEQKAEEDHQLKLWELKMRYLMDLEDALHARDARQIIRLQRQYELDKELLEKKKSQEDEERQQSLEDDLAAVEEKKQERLQDAQIEYQQKLQDLAVAKARELEELNVWKAREQADLAIWYQRELDDIDRQTQQKIEKLLAGYIAEGALHEEQQGKIHEILLKYFGKNKALVDDLVAYTAQGFGNIARLAETIFVQAGSLLAGLGAQVGSVASNPFVNGGLSYDQMVQNQGGGRGRAEGGTVLATKPTTAVFGERGPELATFTPIGRTGRDVNKLFGETGGGGEGRISLDILLSPDLEARIVENSMDGVAGVLARVNRSKV